VSSKSGYELIAVNELDAADAVLWRDWQMSTPRLRAPTLSAAYLKTLAASRPDVRIVRFSRSDSPAFLGIHDTQAEWRAAGLLFNDWQALIRAPDADPDVAYLTAIPDLTVGSWRADVEPIAIEGRLDPVPGYAVALKNGLDDYLNDRRKQVSDHIKKIRRRQRALEEAKGPVRLVWPDANPVARHQLLAWKSAQFRRTGRHDILSSRWLRAFIDAAFHSTDDDCRAELATLYAGDTLIAAEVGFTGLGVNQSWLAAYDQDAARFGPGTLLLQHLIEAAPSRHINHVDLGPGHGGYKQYFANETYTVLSGRLVTHRRPHAGPDLRSLTAWAERQTFPGARLPGQAMRRYAMISACEPSLLGRARGVMSALGSVGRGQRPNP
jgi:CelD/BcsL family acetyltransferase involved in cellulose biosynthesis